MVEQLKSKNVADLLLFLLSNGAATKADLVKGTSLGNTTVSDIINDLTKLQLVREVGKQNSDGGRRSSIYEVCKNYGRFVGVALFSDRFEFVTTDCHNKLIDTRTVAVGGNIPHILTLTDELRNIINSFGDILGIGIGLHGEIEYRTQVITNCDCLKWQYVHLTEIIEREFQCFTYIDHYTNGAALKERIHGAAKGVDNFIYYTNLAPKKSAITLGGKVCRGKRNMAGWLNGSHESIANDLIALKKSMDVEHIFIAEHGHEMHKMQIDSDCTLLLDTDKYNLSQGMAMAAEVQWFYRALWRRGVLLEQIF